jgi:hypothetical protein
MAEFSALLKINHRKKIQEVDSNPFIMLLNRAQKVPKMPKVS